MRSKVAMVVYKIESGKPLFLVCQRPETGIWQYPTGKCESSETYTECAFREIKEELGDVVILNFTDLHEKFEFVSDRGQFSENVVAFEIKEVQKLQAEEFRQYEFLEVKEALEKVEFESHRKYIQMVDDMLKQKQENKFVIIIAPTACGKSVIIKDLLMAYPDKFERVRTYMTREFKRPEDPILRVHVSKEEFLKLFDVGKLIEKNYHDGNWYGSSFTLVEEALKSGKTILAEVDINGASELKKHFSNIVTIFITAPLDEIEFRLRERGGHNDEEIARRLDIAKREIARQAECDHIVENIHGRYEKTFDKIKQIIEQHA